MKILHTFSPILRADFAQGYEHIIWHKLSTGLREKDIFDINKSKLIFNDMNRICFQFSESVLLLPILLFLVFDLHRVLYYQKF